LRKCAGVLSDTEAKVIQLYYFEDKTQADIGQKIKLTESRISQVRQSALVKLRRAFERRAA
jgi:RNA polymerase sigma factor (sigma-70 family)